MTTSRNLAIQGAVLVLLSLTTGLIGPALVNSRMGLSSHLAAMMGGTLLLALAGVWSHVQLTPRGERWAVWLLGYGNFANWLATLLAAAWNAGGGMMPIAARGRIAQPWQDGLIAGLLVTLSLAMIAGTALVLYGLIKRRAA